MGAWAALHLTNVQIKQVGTRPFVVSGPGCECAADMCSQCSVEYSATHVSPTTA